MDKRKIEDALTCEKWGRKFFEVSGVKRTKYQGQCPWCDPSSLATKAERRAVSRKRKES